MAKHRSKRRKKGVNRRSSAPKRSSVSPKRRDSQRAAKREVSADSDATKHKERDSVVPESGTHEVSKRESRPSLSEKDRDSSSKLEDALATVASQVAADQGSDSSVSGEKEDVADEAKEQSHEKPDSVDDEKTATDSAEESKASESSEQSASSDEQHDSEGSEGEEDKDSSGEKDTSDDDGFHHEFFLAGERVEAQHLEERKRLASGKPPVDPEVDVDHRSLRIMAPEVVARRKKLRRYVAYGLAPLVLVAGVAGARLLHESQPTAATSGSARAGAVSTTSEQKQQPSPSAAEVSSLVSAPSASASGAVAADAAVEAMAEDAGVTDAQTADVLEAAVDADSGAEEQATDSSVSDTGVDSSSTPDAGESDSGSEQVAQADDIPAGVNVRKEALKALNLGKWKDALRYSRAALAQDPSDATLYLYLGTALQESGHVKEAKKVYSDCVHKATKGPKTECRAMGGR